MFSGLAIGDGAVHISRDIFRDNPFSLPLYTQTPEILHSGGSFPAG